MMFQNDYIMRQISALVQFLSMLLFGKTVPLYEKLDEQNPTQGDLLHDALIRLLEHNRINEAENLLFEYLDEGMSGMLNVVLDFYHRLNILSDEQLAKAEFSRDEIDTGLRDALKRCGMDSLLDGYRS